MNVIRRIYNWITGKTEVEPVAEQNVPLVAIEALLNGAGTSLLKIKKQATEKAQSLNAGADELDKTAEKEIAAANSEFNAALSLLQSKLNVSLTQAAVKKEQAQLDHLAAQNLYEALNAIPAEQQH